jgi:hypothetical protein
MIVYLYMQAIYYIVHYLSHSFVHVILVLEKSEHMFTNKEVVALKMML